MATCLVTGGAGFLGSHLCDELLRRGHRVICVDNLETGSLVNIEHIRVPEFVHVNADITDPYFVDEPVDVDFCRPEVGHAFRYAQNSAGVRSVAVDFDDVSELAAELAPPADAPAYRRDEVRSHQDGPQGRLDALFRAGMKIALKKTVQEHIRLYDLPRVFSQC